MEKKTIYPKTKRIGSKDTEYQITEKLDGSNLGLYVQDGTLYIAQRNYVFTEHELDEYSQMLYKGLRGWIDEHKEDLKSKLLDNQIVFGEWLGMGNIKYPHLDKKFYMFARQNNEKLLYSLELLKYAFNGYEIPNYIGTVPHVSTKDEVSIDRLDYWYESMSDHSQLEGFIICNLKYNTIEKYVRRKDGKLSKHRG